MISEFALHEMKSVKHHIIETAQKTDCTRQTIEKPIVILDFLLWNVVEYKKLNVLGEVGK